MSQPGAFGDEAQAVLLNALDRLDARRTARDEVARAEAEILRDHLTGMFPDLPATVPAERIRMWLGHRPSMPDGRPCIGRARRTGDVVYAFGHGHVGLVGSARTGRLVAQLVGGAVEEMAVPLRAASFEEWWNRTTALAGPLSAILENLPEVKRVSLRERVRAAVAPYETVDGLELPGVSLLAAAVPDRRIVEA